MLINKLEAPFIKSHIYLDTGHDFSDDERIEFEPGHTGQDGYTVHWEIPDAEKVKRVRFDPVEMQGYILKNVSIAQGEKKLQLFYQNAFEMEEGVFLLGKNPKVYANVVTKNLPIIIDADIVLLGEKHINMIREAYLEEHAELEVMRKKITYLAAETAKFQQKESDLTDEKEGLRTDLGAYTTLALKKDQISLELEQELGRVSQQAHELEQELRRVSQQAHGLEQALNVKVQELNCLEQKLNSTEHELWCYKNLKIVRLRAFVFRILRGIKRRLIRFIGK